MSDFVDSVVKEAIRDSIFAHASELRKDHKFTYLGLPGSECKDIYNWGDNISSAHCCEFEDDRFERMSIKIVQLLSGKGKPHKGNIWDFLKESNKYEEFIDLLNLDFCG